MTLLFTSCSSCSSETDPPPPDVNPLPLPVSLTLEELLDLTQERTFKYFWDFAEPVSGMARERSQDDAYNNESPRIITMGGSGFGIASFPAAVERGWITRNQAIVRLQKILSFLEGADTYHGAFSHWYYGNTGKTRTFGGQDNGGDIVETAFLLQGLLINRQYFSGTGAEKNLRDRITAIWEAVEWDWYTNGQESITWHWSPNHEFALDLKVSGWNEALIVYVLAAASPSHSITKSVYDQGWARNGGMHNGTSYYGNTLAVGPQLGGPLFFAHYSFIGLDPRNLSDAYVANYFAQNKAHTLINYAYCKDNPKGYKGYGGDSWGLTASDNHQGYSAHSPTNDLGVITPTAALSSFPYTPAESEKALKYFYNQLGNKLLGEYGFYDAFSEQHNWYADGYLAIDQGPIVAMIENYRTQQLWKLFMKDPDIQKGLTKLGFSY
ncbi:MAG: beta-glucosidase [Flavobacteriaceae bacterium]|nr:beta-glucosidase [Flavobacteriaceae bacterium]